MNSAPRSRYSTASAPITPTNDRALEIGCVWTTRLIADNTAMPAKTKNRIGSMGGILVGSERDGQAGNQQISERDREHELPRERHQLVVTEARQRTANPDKDK